MGSMTLRMWGSIQLCICLLSWKETLRQHCCLDAKFLEICNCGSSIQHDLFGIYFVSFQHIQNILIFITLKHCVSGSSWFVNWTWLDCITRNLNYFGKWFGTELQWLCLLQLSTEILRSNKSTSWKMIHTSYVSSKDRANLRLTDDDSYAYTQITWVHTSFPLLHLPLPEWKMEIGTTNPELPM